MSTVFKTFFEIGSAVSISILFFVVIPSLFLYKKIVRK